MTLHRRNFAVTPVTGIRQASWHGGRVDPAQPGDMPCRPAFANLPRPEFLLLIALVGNIAFYISVAAKFASSFGEGRGARRWTA